MRLRSLALPVLSVGLAAAFHFGMPSDTWAAEKGTVAKGYEQAAPTAPIKGKGTEFAVAEPTPAPVAKGQKPLVLGNVPTGKPGMQQTNASVRQTRPMNQSVPTLPATFSPVNETVSTAQPKTLPVVAQTESSPVLSPEPVSQPETPAPVKSTALALSRPTSDITPSRVTAPISVDAPEALLPVPTDPNQFPMSGAQNPFVGGGGLQLPGMAPGLNQTQQNSWFSGQLTFQNNAASRQGSLFQQDLGFQQNVFRQDRTFGQNLYRDTNNFQLGVTRDRLGSQNRMGENQQEAMLGMMRDSSRIQQQTGANLLVAGVQHGYRVDERVLSFCLDQIRAQRSCGGYSSPEVPVRFFKVDLPPQDPRGYICWSGRYGNEIPVRIAGSGSNTVVGEPTAACGGNHFVGPQT